MYTNPQNKKIFQKNQIISADRRRKNLGELYKPTVPQRFVEHGPKLEPGYFTCQAKKCDTCKHGKNTKSITSPWDGRTWNIRQHLTCSSKNVIYVLKCKIHPKLLYVGSTKNLKSRWANHKSDTKLKKNTKCTVSKQVNTLPHPDSKDLDYLEIIAIDSVQEEQSLLRKEIFWICNLGTLFQGLNTRQDVHTVHRR